MRWIVLVLSVGGIAGCSGCGGGERSRPDAYPDATVADGGVGRDASTCPPVTAEPTAPCGGRATFEGYYAADVLPVPVYSRCGTCSTSAAEGVGDLDGDGRLDVVYSAVVTHDAIGLWYPRDYGFGYFLQQPSGGFAPAVEVQPPGPRTPSGERWGAIAVGDVDGDGRDDVLQARHHGEQAEIVRIRLEEGGLRSRTLTSTASPPDLGFSNLLLFDLDADSDLDLVVRRAWRNPRQIQETWLMENDGTGNLLLRHRIGIPNYSDVEVGSLDGTAADLIVTTDEAVQRFRFGANWFAGPPEVLLTRDEAEADYFQSRILDLDGDGHLDILVSGQEILQVLLANSQAGWVLRRIDSQRTADSLFPGDFDGDRQPEILSTQIGPYRYLLPGLEPAEHPEIRYRFDVSHPVVADLNGDGRDDVIEGTHAGFGKGIQIFYGGTSAGKSSPYLPGVHSLVLPEAGNLASEDFDGDGNLDIVTGAEGESLYLAPGLGGGALGHGVPLPLADPQRGLVAGDFDGDCRLDLVVGLRYDEAVDFLPGNGDRTFGAPVRSATSADRLFNLQAVDFDRDGVLDLVSTGSQLHLMRGLGDGRFQLTYQSPNVLGSKPGIGDLDGDGHLDFVLPSFEESERRTYLLFGDGAGGVSQEVSIETEPGGIAAAAGDLDGDGDGDLVVASLLGNVVQVFENQSRRAFVPTDLVIRTTRPRIVELMDVTGNGHLDLLIVGDGQGQVLPGRGDGAFEDPIWLGTGGFDLAVADLNADGRPDILRTSGGLSINYGICAE